MCSTHSSSAWSWQKTTKQERKQWKKNGQQYFCWTTYDLEIIMLDSWSVGASSYSWLGGYYLDKIFLLFCREQGVILRYFPLCFTLKSQKMQKEKWLFWYHCEDICHKLKEQHVLSVMCGKLIQSVTMCNREVFSQSTQQQLSIKDLTLGLGAFSWTLNSWTMQFIYKRNASKMHKTNCRAGNSWRIAGELGLFPWTLLINTDILQWHIVI